MEGMSSNSDFDLIRAKNKMIYVTTFNQQSVFMSLILTYFRILCSANDKGEIYKFVFNSAKRSLETPICNIDLSPANMPDVNMDKPTVEKISSG